NVAPTATFSNGGAAEGSPATVTFSSPSDPSAPDTTAGFKYSYAQAPGSLAATYSAATSLTSANFTYADNGAYTVYGRIFDKDNGFTDYSTTVTVTNVAPTATGINGPAALAEGSPGNYSLSGVSDAPVDLSSLHFSFATAMIDLAATYAAAGSANSFN